MQQTHAGAVMPRARLAWMAQLLNVIPAQQADT
jgi:hypothetical protein